jgi:hypothetical protein
MHKVTGETNGRGGIALVSAVAVGALALGAAADHGVTNYRAAHRSYSNSEPQVRCGKLEVVGLDSENVTLLPLVRALGNVPLADLYTKAEDNRNFPTNYHPEKLQTRINPGVTAIQVPLGEQSHLSVSIIISQLPPNGITEIPGSQEVPCPQAPIIVYNR